jgi:membrane fusion protein (multidrug efflux system)
MLQHQRTIAAWISLASILCATCIGQQAYATPTPVYTQKVTTATINDVYQSFGTLKAKNKVTISATVDARVTKIFFQDGQLVTQNAPLIQLDDTTAKAEVAQKQAKLTLAKATYARNQKLIKVGATTQQSLDKLKATVKNDQIALTNAQLELQKLTLKAPFDGQLGSFQVHADDYVTAGQDLVLLVSKSPITVTYSAPQKYSTQLKIGAKIKVSAQAVPKQSFAGQITYISPTVDPQTGTIAIEASIDNKQGVLSPGMFCKIAQVMGQHLNAIVIPPEALLSDIQGNYVYVVKNSHAVRANISVGNIENNQVEVLKGLKQGQLVITQGQQKINEGDLVTATKAKP